MNVIVISNRYEPGFNLAAEKYLFSRQQDETLFLYVNAPCVVIGCNQAVRNEVNSEFCSKKGIEVMRRISGGGAVYHDFGNINYCFIQNRIPGKYPINDNFLKSVVAVLNQLGIPVITGERKDIWLPDGSKISGTASHVGKEKALYHGTLLYDSNLEYLQGSLTPESIYGNPGDPGNKPAIKAIASVRSKVGNIRDYINKSGKGDMSFDEFYDNLLAGFCKYFNVRNPALFNEEEIKEIEIVRKSVFENPEWIFSK